MKKQNRIAFFNFLSVILLKGISLFSAPIFSRILGTDGYGMVSVYTIWVGVVAIVFPLQVHATLPAAKVELPEGQQNAYHSAILTLAMLSCGLFSALVMAFLKPVSQALGLPGWLIGILLLHAFFNFCLQFINQKFVYEFRADLNCLISVLVAVLTLGLSVLFIWLLPEEQKYYGRIFGMALTYGLLGLWACFYILRRGKTGFHREYWKFCLPLGIPMVFYTLSDLILGQSDRVMLQHMMDVSAVGQYSLAMNFGMIMFTIFSALNTSWCPFFFEDMKYGRRDNVRRQMGNFMELYTVLSMGFVLLHREVFQVFADSRFWSAMSCIPLFVLGYYFNFLCTFPVNYEYYRKQTKATALVTILAAAVNIGLNYILIRALGILGAALATMLSHGLQFTVHFFYARFFLGKGDYPFLLGKNLLWPVGFLLVIALTYLTPGLWWLRWTLGGGLGIWELLRIRRRHSLF